MLKIKLEDTFDLKVIDSEWTQGKKGNAAFNLILENKAGVKTQVVVAKHDLIDKFTKKLPEIVEIKCMKKLENGTYREPRFFRERLDKTVDQID